MLKRFQDLLSVATLTSLFFSLLVTTKGNVQAINQPAFVQASENSPEKRSRADYDKTPLLFEENKGQTSREAKFISRGTGYTLYLAESEAVFQLRIADAGLRNENDPQTKHQKPKTKSETLRMRFAGANPNPKIEGAGETVTKTNYYVDKKRIENLANYARVNYRNLYDGIDAVFYGNADGRLEYDFTVAPNADPNKIGLNFEGADSVSVNADGNLVIKTENTELVQPKPVAYQEIDGARRAVEVKYVVHAKSEIGFALGEYDKSRSLTIDPVLSYLTYIGGTAFDEVTDLAVDANGNAYLTGSTTSLDFPSSGARSASDGFGAYAAKLNADGSQFLYVTFLDGAEDDFAFGIALDSQNNAYIGGQTVSNDFPVTSGAFDTNRGLNEDAFVAKLNAAGSIVYATFYGGGGSDLLNDIAVDSGGKAYIVGETRSALSFPKKNEFQGCGVGAPASTNSTDAFLGVFNAAGTDIAYSTCFGGGGFVTGFDTAFSVALDSANNAYITGETNEENFPVKNAAQANLGGGNDAFVIKFNPAQSGDASVIYATYLGGSGTDAGFRIAVTANGTASLTGITGSFNFPLKNAFDSTNQINEAFVTQYGSTGALLNSSFLGGSDQEDGLGIALGNTGTIYVVGETFSSDFPLAVPFQSTKRSARDAFVTKIRFGINNNPGVSSSSFLGGNGGELATAVAVRGNFIFVAGITASNNLSTTGGVIKPTSNASGTAPDGFVAKILDTHLDTVGTYDPANTLFKLKNSLTGGAPDITVDRGAAGDVPVAGDFNGDGIDTVSTFNNGVWKIQQFNTLVSGYGVLAATVNFGAAGDLPIVGDWNNDGIDTPGVYRPSAGQFFLTNAVPVNNSTPNVDITVTFGIAEDLPVAGDWNADGFDSVGVFRPSAGQFFLTDDNVLAPTIDQVFNFGTNGDLPIAGDWNGNGIDNVGVWRPSNQTFFLTNDHINISNQFVFGAANEKPVAGDWDGKP